MSALEPDSPAPHVFPHAREAIRAWWAHRQGQQPSRAALGRVRGKGPGVSDFVRVGQLLSDLDLLQGGDPTPMGRRVIQWALTGGEGAREKALQAATKRLMRWGRKTGIVAKAQPRYTVRTYSSPEIDGVTHKYAVRVDSC